MNSDWPRPKRRRAQKSQLHPTALVVAVVGVALSLLTLIFVYLDRQEREEGFIDTAADELAEEISAELIEIDELLVGIRSALSAAEEARAQLPAIAEVAVARSDFVQSVSVLRFDPETGIEIDAFGDPVYANVDSESLSPDELADVTARLQDLEDSPTDRLQLVSTEEVDGDAHLVLSTKVESTQPNASVPEWIIVVELRFPAELIAGLRSDLRGSPHLALFLSAPSSDVTPVTTVGPDSDATLLFTTETVPFSGELRYRPIELYDQPGVLVVAVEDSPLTAGEQVTPLLALVAGLAITAVLTPLVNRLARRREEVQLLSTQRDDLDDALAVSQQIERELRASEGRFRSVLHSTPDVIAWIDLDGDAVQILNRDNLLGHPLYRVTTTNSLTALVHPDDKNLARDGIAKLRSADPGVVTEFECRLRRTDDLWEWLRIRGGRVERSEAEQGYILAVLTNVTEQKNEEARRSALEQQLVQSQRLEAIGQLAGGVAHDFKNILAAILSGTDLLLDEVEGPVVGEVAEIRRTAVRGSDLAGELLQFSRRDRGSSPRVVDINDIIHDVHTMLTRTLDESVTLDLELGPELYPVHIDPSQIERVLMNLTINARDAMSDGGTITVTTTNVDAGDEIVDTRPVEPGPYVCLAVGDTGEGMPDEVRQRAFEPFFSTKDAGKGTGLGLATVYGIVQGAQGHIDIHSEPGSGTTLRILLPRTRLARPVAKGADAQQGRRDAEEAGNGQAHRVLVVDPESETRAAATELLEAEGYDVSSAGDGREALVVARNAPVDVLLTDVVLSGDINGRDLAIELREQTPGIEVLYLNGEGDEVLDEVGVDDDADEALILRKPFTQDMLHRAVRAAVQRSL